MWSELRKRKVSLLKLPIFFQGFGISGPATAGNIMSQDESNIVDFDGCSIESCNCHGCTPIYHQQFKWILRNDYWTTTCSILSYSTSPDSAASAAAGLASAGFGATFCGSSSSESMSSSPSQNCCKIQCIQNCQFRRPGEELVYGIQFPIPKQQHFGFIAQTLWDSKILRGHLDAATGVICFSVKTPHTPQDKGHLRSM